MYSNEKGKSTCQILGVKGLLSLSGYGNDQRLE